ncbi:Uncharacterized protein PBTT_07360 [Plasmodiophora brassicae]
MRLVVWAVVVGLATAGRLALTYDSGRVVSYPAYPFAFGNVSFAVVNASKVQFVEVTTVTVNVAALANACHDCAGLVLYASSSSLLRTVLQYLAWVYRPVPTSLPILVVSDGFIDAGTAQVTLESGGASGNSVAIAVGHPAVTTLYTILTLIYIASLVFAVFRLLQYVVDETGKPRAPPVATAVILVGFIASQIIRIVKFQNTAWQQEQSITYPALVFVAYADFPIMCLSRVSLQVILSRSQDKTPLAERVALPIIVAIMLAQVVVVAMATVTQVMPMGIVATYFFFLATAILFATVQGYAIVCVGMLLLKSIGQSAAEIAKRKTLLRRMGSSWTIAVAYLLAQFIVLAVQNSSPMHFLVANALSQMIGCLAPVALMAALRPTPSKMGRFFSMKPITTGSAVPPHFSKTVPGSTTRKS